MFFVYLERLLSDFERRLYCWFLECSGSCSLVFFLWYDKLEKVWLECYIKNEKVDKECIFDFEWVERER